MTPDEERPDLSLIQSDLAVNLFMVLLSILSTLAIIAAVVSADGFRTDMRDETPQKEDTLALSPGWAPVQDLRDRILIRPDGLYGFDSGALAQAFATGNPVDLNDASQLFVDDPDPQSYRVLVNLGGEVPAPVTLWHIPVDQLGEGAWPDPWSGLLDSAARVDLAVYQDSDLLAWQVAQRLHAAQVPFRLLFQTRERINYGRRTSLFSFEDTYK